MLCQKRIAPDAAEETPTKKPKTQPKSRATADTQSNQKVRNQAILKFRDSYYASQPKPVAKVAKVTSAAPGRADSWTTKYQEELNNLPPAETQKTTKKTIKKTTKKTASNALHSEPGPSTPFEPPEPSTSTAPQRKRAPRPKMLNPPPLKDSPAPTTTHAAKSELVDAVEVGKTKVTRYVLVILPLSCTNQQLGIRAAAHGAPSSLQQDPFLLLYLVPLFLLPFVHSFSYSHVYSR